MKKSILRNALVCFIAMVVAAVLMMGASMIYMRGHLANISDNQSLFIRTKRGTLEPNYKDKKAYSNTVFYRDNCPHCQLVVPPAIVMNKLTGNHVTYRDLNMPGNQRLADQIHDNSFPDLRELHVNAQSTSVQASPSRSVYLPTFGSVLFHAIMYLFILAIISILAALLLF